MTCNVFIGTYSTGGEGEVRLNLEIQSYVGCATDFEETFAAITDEVTNYRIQNNQLTLSFDGRPGQSLVFEQIPDPGKGP
jgi:heat shock protein HslJ